MPYKTFYEILGVDPEASMDVIKKAFQKLASQHHPDKGGDEETFKAIRAAYEVLHDVESRFEYDTVLAEESDRAKAKKDAEVAETITQILQGVIAESLTLPVKPRITSFLRRRYSELTAKKAQCGLTISNLRVARNKVITKNGAKNLFAEIIDKKIEAEMVELEVTQAAIEIIKKVEEALVNYEDVLFPDDDFKAAEDAVTKFIQGNRPGSNWLTRGP